MYKILISGYYGFHNIGDEAVLRCVAQRVRDSVEDAELTILSNDPQDTAEKYHVRAVPRMHPWKVLKAIFQTDMLISGGGSLLQDTTSRISILYYLSIIALSLILGKRVCIYSQGIGPIRGKVNRKLTGFLLKRVHSIAVRDGGSAALLRDIGVPPEKIAVTADPVLWLRKADPQRGREILSRIGVRKQEGRLVVGWALKASTPEFLDQVERSIRYLKERYNADSVLIPFHYEQDAPVIEELAGRLGGDACYLTDKLLIDEMLSLTGNLDLLVGVRLHSLIYAAVSGVPSIGISYDPKIDAFLDSVSRKSVSDTREFTLEKLLPAVDEILENRQEILAETERQVEVLRRRLDVSDHMVVEQVRPVTGKPRKKGGVASVIGSVMFITVFAKVLAILRESVQANIFGAADAFYAGYNKTIYLFTTAAYAMCVAAVPIITKEMTKSRRDGEKCANNLITVGLILSVAALAVWELASLSPLAAVFFGGDPAVLPFVRVMALSLPVIVAAYLMVALFQSLDHFALQGSMSLPYSVFLIGYLILFGHPEKLGGYVWLVVVGWCLQFAMCLPYAVREKYRYRPRLEWKAEYLKLFVRTALVTIITGSMYLFCYLLDASAAENMGAGTTSAFYYADKLFTPLTTTFIYSITAVLFPRLSREYTKNDEESYKLYVWNITENTLLVVFPVTAVLMVFGAPILRILFESGNFTADHTAATAEIFVMYILGMAGFSVMDLVNKAFFTMGRSGTPLLISLGTIGLNFLLNRLIGVSGPMLALTTAVSMTVGGIVSIRVLFRGQKLTGLKDLGKTLAASAVMGLAAWGLKLLVVPDEVGKLTLILLCVGIGVAAMVIFVGLAFLLRIEAITSLLRPKAKND